ncbi:MAG TPA: DNA polymerase IV [Opitutales bacterium]|nr:DNA polymerase IV [Opitutales bacterium]
MRTIIHIDMDCFYAAIEVRERPELRGKAVAVGGSSHQRGVITTCSYEARKFGVRSAMPTYLALRRCPELIVLPTRFDLYREESAKIRRIFSEFTSLIEPLSLDEAYLDVSDDSRDGWEIASLIRKRIFEETGLTASAGIGPNKLIAKIASDLEKPDGQFQVKETEVAAFMKNLSVRKLWGVGPVAAERLERRGIRTCADLQKIDAGELIRWHGRFGWELYELCRGIDRRKVEPSRPRKSLSTERTFPRDLQTLEECRREFFPLLQELSDDLRKKAKDRTVEKLFVKLTFSDFSRTSVEQTGSAPSARIYNALLKTGFRRGGKPVRLIGVGVRFSESAAKQLEFEWVL